MAPGPPRLLEAFFAIWIPPVCRQEVLGDLCEKYSGPAQYVLLAIRTIPLVILSRARRVTEAPVVFMQALLIYGCYVAAAFYRDSAFLYGPDGLLRTALPLLPFLFVAVLFDVYGPPVKSALQLAARVSFAALIAFLMMAGTLPVWMNLLGASGSLLLVTAVRILFRSDPDMQQAAGPAHWLRQTPAPIALPRTTLGVVVTAAVVAGAASAILLWAGVNSIAVVIFCVVFGAWMGRRKG
jgi:hypothetical protein